MFDFIFFNQWPHLQIQNIKPRYCVSVFFPLFNASCKFSTTCWGRWWFNSWTKVNPIRLPWYSMCLKCLLREPYVYLHIHAGGVFSRQAEVIFQPNNERLIIKQKFNGINEHGQLIMSTELEGRVPAIPLGYSVQINPYKEIYFYETNSKNITT